MNTQIVYQTEQLDDDLYMITETDSVHCYVILGQEKALLFDIGYGYEDILPYVRQITSLPVMLVVSHGDPDHALGCGWFNEVWIHPLDWGKVLLNDTTELRAAAYDYRAKKMPDFTQQVDRESFINQRITHTMPHFLVDKDVIDLGDLTLEVVHTPGHSYGHIMLIDQAHHRLFTGDQVTAHNVWYFQSNDVQAPFAQAVEGLEKVQQRAKHIEKLYPAHDVTPISPDAINDQLYCFKKELCSNYQNDVPFHSFIGEQGFIHRYKSFELIYSDERLAKWLNHDIARD